MKSQQNRVLQFLVSLCDETNTPFSQMVKKLATEGQVAEICSLKIDPRNYDTPATYYRDAVVAEFLRKFVDFDLGRDLDQEAVDLFYSLERRNRATNDYFAHLDHGHIDIHESRVLDFLQRVKENVQSLLGPIPASLEGRFGKGSTVSDRGRFITVPDKICSQPTCTKRSRDFIPLWAETAWARSLYTSSHHSEPLTVRGNRFTSVPKTSTSKRGICIEPGLNVYWQLAVGTHIKERLRTKFGYNLYTAQDRHREMARVGSLTQRWATIDLKNASDLFSHRFVKQVLPDVWYALLDSLRSHSTEVGGKYVLLEKFSSMGNGFTFEIMTVILTAICVTISGDALKCEFDTSHEGAPRGSRDGDISVFGDDIIVRPEVAKILLKCLPACGLEINHKKTFLEGPFRESCGGDYFMGVDVRTFNLESDPQNVSELIALANAVRKLGRQHRDGVDGFPSFLRTWFSILDAIPTAQRWLRGPEFLGDLVIHDSQANWQIRTGKRLHYRELPDKRKFVRGWLPIIRKRKLTNWPASTQLAAALYGVPSDGPSLRGEIAGYRKGWLALGM